MLKHSEEYWLSMEALSKSLVTVVPFLTKAELDGLKFLKCILCFAMGTLSPFCEAHSTRTDPYRGSKSSLQQQIFHTTDRKPLQSPFEIVNFNS